MKTRSHAIAVIAVLLALLLPMSGVLAASRADSPQDGEATFDTPKPKPKPRPNAKKTPRPARKTPRPAKTAEPVTTPAVLAPARSSLTVGYRESGVLGQAPLLVALEAGYFDEVGLTDVVIVEVPRNALRDLRAGDLDIAVVGARQAAMANAEDEHLRALAGYRNYLGDNGAYGGDVLLARPGLVAHEPSTVIAFLNAYVRALQELSEPDAAQAALDIIEAGDLAVEPSVAANWIDALASYAHFDGGFGDPSQGGGSAELEAYLTADDGSVPDLDSFIAQATLNLAQATVGIAANPDSAFLGLPVADVSVALPIGDDTTSPITAADAAGYFEDAGFSSVEIMDIEQPLLGVLTGEVDLGVVSMSDAADGITQGLNIQAVAGHRNYAPDGSYGGDVLVATTDLIANEPATVSAFLSAYLRALQSGAAEEDAAPYAPHDGGYGTLDDGGGLGELAAFVEDALGVPVDMEALIAQGPLEFAQASLGLPANPTTAPTPTTALTEEEAA